MFELDRLMTRLVLRQQVDANGNPTDDALISVQRLHQFMRPIFFRKKTESGFCIRLEWLGYYEEEPGTDVFAVEAALMDRVLQHFRDDSKQFTLHRMES